MTPAFFIYPNTSISKSEMAIRTAGCIEIPDKVTTLKGMKMHPPYFVAPSFGMSEPAVIF